MQYIDNAWVFNENRQSEDTYMTTSNATSSVEVTKKSPFSIGLILGISALIGVLMIPFPTDLPIAGQRMLAILAFAVIVWISEAVSYEVSAVIIITLMAFLLGTAPTIANPNITYGTSTAITIALAGFSSSALALVAGALFIAAAMTFTGLDKRIALITLTKIGTSTKSIMIGSIIITVLLSLLVPSATARSAALVPIMMGIISAFGVDKRSNIAAGIMIIVAQATGIWNIGIKTAAAQNLLTAGFMENILHQSPTWLDWFLAGAPWSLIMSIILISIVLKILPPKAEELNNSKEKIKKALLKLGSMTAPQKRLMLVSALLLFFWSSEGKLHNFDTSSTTYFGLVLLMLPRIGVISWKDVQSSIPWGAIVIFGVGISLGSALLSTEAGQWLGEQVILYTGLDNLGPIAIFAVLSAFLIVIHLGFASATALASAILPILISVLTTLPGDFNRVGITMLLGFTVSFGFILPINAPQNMVCIGTNTFDSKQFAKVGILLTIIGYLLMLVFSMTYWKWLGLV